MDDSDEALSFTAATAAEVCRGRSLSEAARPLLADGLSPRVYLEALIGAGLLADAEVVMAHALPKREAVWWACRCVRRAVGPEPAAEVAEALRAAETWSAAPGEVNRRKAYPAAEAAGFGHPAGCVAVAAYFSGGSLSLPQLTEVPPAPHLTGDLVASALMLAAVLGDPAAAAEAHRAFLDLGWAVARGDDRWSANL